MRPRRMSRLTLPVVLIAAAIAFPAGASASAGFPAGSSISVQQPQQNLTQPQPTASDGVEWTDAGIVTAIALGLLGVAGGTVLFAAHTRRRTA